MQVAAILEELKEMGQENIKRIFQNHGSPETTYGVKVGDLKKIQKRVKKDYELSKGLYKTGITDAMYLAGLIADEKKMTKEDLQYWVEHAFWPIINEYTVPWVAAESKYGWELGLQWIESSNPNEAAAGWCTLSGVVSLRKDEELDIKKLKALLDRVVKTIHEAPNRVRYTMNGFVISVGAYVASLSDDAVKAGKKIGKVHVEMGDTACKVPSAPEYIQKAIDRGSLGKKRKTVRC